MLSKTNFPMPILGISSCLLGNEVRYDSGHKRSRYVCSTLSHFFKFQPFCPEVAIGLGVPRPPIHLVQLDDEIRVFEVNDSSKDYTAPLSTYAKKTAINYLNDISGFIFKKSSPSCGMIRVKVYRPDGAFLHKKGTGIFAQVIQQQHPLLPVEEEDRLTDLNLRESFLVRVYVYYHWQRLLDKGLTANRLVAFHDEKKYLLIAHNQQEVARLRASAANEDNEDITALAQRYMMQLMEMLKQKPLEVDHL